MLFSKFQEQFFFQFLFYQKEMLRFVLRLMRAEEGFPTQKVQKAEWREHCTISEPLIW